jgi:hypothetical protein
VCYTFLTSTVVIFLRIYVYERTQQSTACSQCNTARPAAQTSPLLSPDTITRNHHSALSRIQARGLKKSHGCTKSAWDPTSCGDHRSINPANYSGSNSWNTNIRYRKVTRYFYYLNLNQSYIFMTAKTGDIRRSMDKYTCKVVMKFLRSLVIVSPTNIFKKFRYHMWYITLVI